MAIISLSDNDIYNSSDADDTDNDINFSSMITILFSLITNH